MVYTTDNRWNTGSLESVVPDTAKAAYGARWIDHGTTMDVVPDRQGFAYDETDDRDRLIRLMEGSNLRVLATGINRDLATPVVTNTGALFHVWMRRSGGYVYVAAWVH